MRVPAFLLALMTATTALAGRAPGRRPRPERQDRAGRDGQPQRRRRVQRRRPRRHRLRSQARPQGAQASVTIESGDGQTRTSLVVEGLLPGRRYGAHLHTKPCGRKPDDAGPHYQHHPGRIDADSEVWLDFTTDDEGAGRSSARNDWMLERAKLPGSLVIHSQPTTTSGPEVGQAGRGSPA
ncbi:hypothetical protein ACFQ0B_23055 [Nonomuraea thailandensis]